MTYRTYDVVVIGGGAAGLSAALTLGRARRSVLVVDAGQPRNAPAAHAHNYLGREGVNPLELLSIGREEVRAYGGEIVQGIAVSAERTGPDGFRVALDDGSAVKGRRLLVATGLTDELPDIPGIAERWGRDVLHCPYCHGWEVRDRAIGIVARSGVAMHQALLWRQWTADLTLFLNNSFEPSDDEREQLDARGIEVVTGAVTGLEITGDALSGVRLDDGRVVTREAVVTQARMTANADLLGLRSTKKRFGELVMGSYVEAQDPFGATEIPGVWVAGDVANVAGKLIGAAAAGVDAGAGINADLVAEDTRRAVSARNATFTAELEREVAEIALGDRKHGMGAL